MTALGPLIGTAIGFSWFLLCFYICKEKLHLKDWQFATIALGSFGLAATTVLYLAGAI